MSTDPLIDDGSVTITITGGAGGQAADTADIATSADLIAAAAVHLDDARARCDQVTVAVALAQLQECFNFSPTRDPVDGIYLRGAVDAAELLTAALRIEADHLVSLDGRTRSAGEVLEAAEQEQVNWWSNAYRTVDGWDLSPMGFGRTFLGGMSSASGGSVQERLVAGLGAGLGKYNFRRNPFRPPQVSDAAAVLQRGASFYSSLKWPLSSVHLPGAQQEPPRDLRPGHLAEHRTMAAPVTSVTGAMKEIAELDRETIEIQKYTQNDGTVTWGVFVRGMDDLTIGSNSPFSAENNLVLAQGEHSSGMALVESAMQQAGIPVGAAVGLYGHSEGGTVAASLAADSTFRRRYDLRNVTTFGSPVAGITPDPPVPMLNVQNQDEIISSLAGVAPPDSPERVTIDANLPGLKGTGPSGHSAHNPHTHSDVLDLALARGLPGVAAAVEQQTAVLGDSGAWTVPPGMPESIIPEPTPPAAVETMFFSPGAEITPPAQCAPSVPPAPFVPPSPFVPPAPVLPPSPFVPQGPPGGGFSNWGPPTPPTLPDGSIDWAEATRQTQAAARPVG